MYTENWEPQAPFSFYSFVESKTMNVFRKRVENNTKRNEHKGLVSAQSTTSYSCGDGRWDASEMGLLNLPRLGNWYGGKSFFGMHELVHGTQNLREFGNLLCVYPKTENCL